MPDSSSPINAVKRDQHDTCQKTSQCRIRRECALIAPRCTDQISGGFSLFNSWCQHSNTEMFARHPIEAPHLPTQQNRDEFKKVSQGAPVTVLVF
jgi:hypothetical protein